MNKIYMMADIHGRKNPIRDFYNRIKEKEGIRPTGTDTMILLGDSQLNYFFNYRDENLKRDLMAYSMTYFIIRGNHEERPENVAANNPNKWHKEMFWGNWVWVEDEFPRIKYALDQPAVYHIPYIIGYANDGDIIWGTYKTLVLPGAYSVDKWRRLENGWSWFKDEQMSPREREDGLRLIEKHDNKFDIILSHASPVMFEPTDLFLSVVDQNTVDKETERYLGHIEYLVEYDTWFWGHYHKFREYPRTCGRRQLMLYNDAAIDLVQYMNYPFSAEDLKI